MSWIERIKKLNIEVLADEKSLDEASRDASLFEVRPQAVARPKNVEEIRKIIEFAKSSEDKISLTVRSGGTGMDGGALSESLVIDMTRLNRLGEVRDNKISCQPGVYYRDFDKKTRAQGLIMPAYPASRQIATVGGMVANNAGGEKTLKYGKVADWVASLKVMFSDGQEYEVRRLEKYELDEKLEQSDFEGEVYRQAWKLVTKNQERIKKSKPKVSKNSAGYSLWEVWNEESQTFDLSKLIIGSQGTLGIITEITWRLTPPAEHSRMLVMVLKNTDRLGEITDRVLKYTPETFESYDDHTLKLALKFMPGIIKAIGSKDGFGLLFSFLADAWLTLRTGFPKMVLLAEFTGNDSEEVLKNARAAKTSMDSLDIPCRLTKSETEVRKYYAIRRESFNLLRNKLKNKRTAPFIDDFVVRPEFLPVFLPELDSVLNKYDLVYTIAGHVGDGNFHIIPIVDPTRKDLGEIVNNLSREVYDLVIKYEGSITGEHNDGIVRTPFLEQMYGKEVVALFEQIKNIFDPHNMFNPGKKVGGTWEFAQQHLIKE